MSADAPVFKRAASPHPDDINLDDVISHLRARFKSDVSSASDNSSLSSSSSSASGLGSPRDPFAPSSTTLDDQGDHETKRIDRTDGAGDTGMSLSTTTKRQTSSSMVDKNAIRPILRGPGPVSSMLKRRKSGMVVEMDALDVQQIQGDGTSLQDAYRSASVVNQSTESSGPVVLHWRLPSSTPSVPSNSVSSRLSEKGTTTARSSSQQTRMRSSQVSIHQASSDPAIPATHSPTYTISNASSCQLARSSVPPDMQHTSLHTDHSMTHAGNSSIPPTFSDGMPMHLFPTFDPIATEGRNSLPLTHSPQPRVTPGMSAPIGNQNPRGHRVPVFQSSSTRTVLIPQQVLSAPGMCGFGTIQSVKALPPISQVASNSLLQESAPTSRNRRIPQVSLHGGSSSSSSSSISIRSSLSDTSTMSDSLLDSESSSIRLSSGLSSQMDSSVSFAESRLSSSTSSSRSSSTIPSDADSLDVAIVVPQESYIIFDASSLIIQEVEESIGIHLQLSPCDLVGLSLEELVDADDPVIEYIASVIRQSDSSDSSSLGSASSTSFMPKPLFRISVGSDHVSFEWSLRPVQVKEPAELEGEVIDDQHFFCLSLKVVSSPVANCSKTSHKMNLSLPSSEALKFISTSECSSLSMLSFDLYLRLLLEISDSSLRVGSDLIYLIENSLSRIDFSASDVENIFGDFFRRFSDSIISTWKQVQGSSEVVPSHRIGETDLSCLEDPAKVLLAFSKSSCSELNQESALSPHLFPLLPVPRFQKPYQDMLLSSRLFDLPLTDIVERLASFPVPFSVCNMNGDRFGFNHIYRFFDTPTYSKPCGTVESDTILTKRTIFSLALLRQPKYFVASIRSFRTSHGACFSENIIGFLHTHPSLSIPDGFLCLHIFEPSGKNHPQSHPSIEDTQVSSTYRDLRPRFGVLI